MNKETDDHMSLHVFVDVSSETAAKEVGTLIANALGGFGTVVVNGVKPYWKIEDYFELFVEVRNPAFCSEHIISLADALGVGWTEAGSSLIWNDMGASSFVNNRVRWANFEFIEI